MANDGFIPLFIKAFHGKDVVPYVGMCSGTTVLVEAGKHLRAKCPKNTIRVLIVVLAYIICCIVTLLFVSNPSLLASNPHNIFELDLFILNFVKIGPSLESPTVDCLFIYLGGALEDMNGRPTGVAAIL